MSSMQAMDATQDVTESQHNTFQSNKVCQEASRVLAASDRIRLTAAIHAVDFSQALSTELLMMRPEAFAKSRGPCTNRDPGCAMP